MQWPSHPTIGLLAIRRRTSRSMRTGRWVSWKRPGTYVSTPLSGLAEFLLALRFVQFEWLVRCASVRKARWYRPQSSHRVAPSISALAPLTSAPWQDVTAFRSTRFVRMSATALAWILSAYIVLTTIFAVHRLYFAAPYGDVWWFVRDMSEFRSHLIGLDFLWRQHSEHRIVLPRLILWIDLHFFRFRGIFSIFCSFLFQAAEALLLCLTFWRVGKNDPASKLAYAALVFGMMFSASQIENFILPFQVQFPLAFFAASLSIFLILRHCETPSGNWMAMILGLFAAVCGTLSLASGLLIWPVLLLVCLFERASIRTLITVAIAGMAMWIFYFIGYLSPPDLNPLVSLTHPMAIAAFTFTFLASALNSTPSRFAGVLGLCSLFVGAVGFLLYVRARSDSFRKLPPYFVYLALFIVATAFLAALGRLNFGIGQAEVSRYRTPTLIFWASILGLLFSWRDGRAGDMGRSLGTPVLAALFLAFFIAPSQRPPLEQFARLSKQVNDAGMALAFDATDKAYAELFSLKPDFVRAYAPFLKENHLSIFADRLFTAKGGLLTAFFVGNSPEECSGSFEGLKLPEDGSGQKGTVFGWGWLDSESRGVATVVIGDDRGVIVGLAHGMARRPDLAAYFRNPKMLATGWSGYFHAEPTSRIITAWAVLPDGQTLCPLGQVVLRR